MDSLKKTHMKLAQYRKFLNSAVSAGVPFDDIITETRKYHGDDFTLHLLKDMRSRL